MSLQYVDGILALVGVMVGFALSAASGTFKDRQRYKVVRKALFNELTTTLNTLETSDRTENHLMLSKDKFPFITENYDALKVELAAFIKPEKLFIVQKAYAQINKLNSPMGHDHPEGFLSMADGLRYYQLITVNMISDLIKEAKKCLN